MAAERKNWTDSDCIQLRELVQANHTNIEIASIMGRTSGAISHQKSLMNLSRKRKNPIHLSKEWTEADNEQLRELTKKKIPAREIARLQNRTLGAVEAQKNRLGIKTNPDKKFAINPWTEEEREQLRKLFMEQHTEAEIASIMNRTKESISGQKALLGLKSYEHIETKWTEEEYERLSELAAAHYSVKEIAALMNRTIGSIEGQKALLGLKNGRPWDKKALDQLKALVSENKSNEEIAQIMDRSKSAIQQAKLKNGMGGYTSRKWTEKEISELRELSSEMTIADLGHYFNRDWTSVERKCKALGIKTQSKNVDMRPYTEEENQYLISHSRYMGSEQLGEKLNRSAGSITTHKMRLRKQGIDVPYYQRGIVKPVSLTGEDTNS
jgi:DNA-binding CsgD family transcriptional regulator